MNNLKQVLFITLALSIPSVNAFDGYQDDIEVRVNRHRGNMAKQPTSTKLSKELVARLKIARDASHAKQQRAIPEVITKQKNSRVVKSTDTGDISIVALQAYGTLDLPGLGTYNTGYEQDVPVLVAMRNGKAVWATCGQAATIVEHIALNVTEDGQVIATLCVHGTNDNALYTFGDKTLVTPESDIDGVVVLVKVDAKTGKTLDMEAYPVVLPKPLFTY